jgi:general secretion pathway protein C
MENPEFGATRLHYFLKQEEIDISFSSIYNILKRHGLQNREKRRARVKIKQVVEEIRERDKKSSSNTVFNEVKIPPTPVQSIKTAHSNFRLSGSFALTLFNIFLLGLLIFSGFHTVKHLRSTILEPKRIVESPPSLNSSQSNSAVIATLPLKDYQPIWEKQTFSTSKREATVAESKSAIVDLPLARKDLGLKLVGTVVSDDPKLNRALIDNLRARTQGIYSVDDRIGRILIKNILTDRIIINAGHGDTVLEMRDPLTVASRLPHEAEPAKKPVRVIPRSGGRHQSITLSRETVVSALSDIDRTLNNVYISSGKVFNRKTGFRIASFEPDTIFSQIGLRNYDLILSINDQKIKSPEQAKTFFDKIREGGSLDIKVRRRARTHHIYLSIE